MFSRLALFICLLAAPADASRIKSLAPGPDGMDVDGSEIGAADLENGGMQALEDSHTDVEREVVEGGDGELAIRDPEVESAGIPGAVHEHEGHDSVVDEGLDEREDEVLVERQQALERDDEVLVERQDAQQLDLEDSGGSSPSAVDELERHDSVVVEGPDDAEFESADVQSADDSEAPSVGNVQKEDFQMPDFDALARVRAKKARGGGSAKQYSERGLQ